MNNINLSFRENEFVAILGPSGSGKTTLLNVIGGLEHYDSGDLVIDHISTRGYSARDWDSYRNHSIGFIFQSYNLIQHQNILSNVEMGTVMGTVTRIITIISSALIATVAVSLVVSSIMIGVITYISVLERRKEIGILRAIGASKHNIAQIFNAETFITGFVSGCMGVGLAYLMIMPLNAFLHRATQIQDIGAFLPEKYALMLIVISVVLTTIGGIIPAHNVSKSDPVEALRTE